jgi:hypothetical protein
MSALEKSNHTLCPLCLQEAVKLLAAGASNTSIGETVVMGTMGSGWQT